MRFMGGREFGAIAGERPSVFAAEDVERLVARRTMALPCFAETGGPFAGQRGRVEGPVPETDAERAALATLYVVLMTDHCLGALGAQGRVVVEGAFTANRFFGPLLAGLAEARDVVVSDDSSGTTCGAWLLDAWGRQPDTAPAPVEPWSPSGWRAYRDAWLAAAGAG
jgi:L-fuculokinase